MCGPEPCAAACSTWASGPAPGWKFFRVAVGRAASGAGSPGARPDAPRRAPRAAGFRWDDGKSERRGTERASFASIPAPSPSGPPQRRDVLCGNARAGSRGMARSASQNTVLRATLRVRPLPSGSPVFGFTSNFGKLEDEMSSRMRCPLAKRLAVAKGSIVMRKDLAREPAAPASPMTCGSGSGKCRPSGSSHSRSGNPPTAGRRRSALR